ncbi:MAG: DUF2059 domain-containing protein [Sphingomonadaceae bacterium]
MGLICAQPAAAATPKKDDDAAAMSALSDMFKAEPLTPAQQARMPTARALIMQIMPPGSMSKIYNTMFKRYFDPMMKMADGAADLEVAADLGQDADTLSLSKEQAKQVVAILDPSAQERKQRSMESFQKMLTKAMTVMEPDMREGMAEAYAVNFDDKELADIGAFFATPSGTAFAQRSVVLASDPHILAATMKGLPKMMDQLAPMKTEIEKSLFDTPAPRSYASLTLAERQELGKLTGLSQAQIKAGMASAAKTRADKATMDHASDD